ncbi:MAG: GldM family protein [Bacteroidota bacterium]|nr:GldM family protein [Bacteroidota bacterium]
MAGGKETPRQKMIGMMYLVLTALLALNISKEVLNGFVKVENSLQETQQTLKGKVAETLTTLEVKYAQNKEKVGPFMDKAREVRERSDNLVNYITQLKGRCMAKSEGKYAEAEANGFVDFIGKDESGMDTTINLAVIQKKDEYQELTAFMVGSEPQKPKFDENDPWSAAALRANLEAYRDYLREVKLVDSQGNTRELPEYIKVQLDDRFTFENEMEDGKEVLWEAANFFDVPLAAVMPLMSKMIVDVQDAQEDVLSWLLGGIEAKSYKFTTLKPLVVPESNYILRGDSFRADVLLAAYDATNAPDIYVDGAKWDGRDSTALEYEGLEGLSIGSDGMGKLRIPTRGMSLGEMNFKGLIRYQGPDGNIEPFSFYTPTITVAEPALVVSPTKMNVFYRGVPNPVEVSVPGVPQDKIDVRIDGGHKIKKESDGTYTVEPSSNSSVREANITVTAELPDGSKKSLPAKNFRVKRIPDPVAFWTGKRPSDKGITMAEVKSFAPVAARMEGFDFDVKVRVKSFTLKVSKDGSFSDLPSGNNRLTSDQQEALKRLRRGNVIYLEDILVSMPDGTERDLPPMKLKITG